MKKRTIISVLTASFSLSACLLINTFVSESSNVNIPQEIIAATNTDNSKEQWYLIGNFDGTDFKNDYPLSYNANTDKYEIIYTFKKDDQFKLRLNKLWNTSIGYSASGGGRDVWCTNSSQNFKIKHAGTYIITVDDNNVAGYGDKSYGMSIGRIREYYVDTNNQITGNRIYFYTWNKSSNSSMSSWPGTEMTKMTNNLYAIRYEDYFNCDRFIINNNGSTQTNDLTYAHDNKTFIKLTSKAQFSFHDYGVELYESWMAYSNGPVAITNNRIIGTTNAYPESISLMMCNGDTIKLILVANSVEYWVDTRFNTNDWSKKFESDTDKNLKCIDSATHYVKLSFGIDLGFYLTEITATSEINACKKARADQLIDVVEKSTGFNSTPVSICNKDGGVLTNYKTFFTSVINEYNKLNGAGCDLSTIKPTINVLSRGLGLSSNNTFIISESLVDNTNLYIIISIFSIFGVAFILFIKRRKIKIIKN